MNFNEIKQKCLDNGGKEVSRDDFKQNKVPWNFFITTDVKPYLRIDWYDENLKGWFKAEKI